MGAVRGTFPFVIANFPIWSETGWYVWENTSALNVIKLYSWCSISLSHLKISMISAFFWNLFILFLKILEPASSHRSPVNLWWFDNPLQNNPMQEQCANLLYEKILIWKSKVLYRLNAIQILFSLKDAILYKMRMAQWSYPRPWFLFGELKIHNRLCVCSLLLLFFWPS